MNKTQSLVLRPRSGPGRGFYTKVSLSESQRKGELSRYLVWTIGLHDKWTELQKCFADSHERVLEFVLMFGLIRSQNKCGIYHFRIVSPHSSSFTRCLIFPGPREAAVSNDSALRPKYVLFTKYSEHPNIFMVIPTHPPLTNKHRTFSGW